MQENSEIILGNYGGVKNNQEVGGVVGADYLANVPC